MTERPAHDPVIQPLPADAIWVHVGVHKTGTTALQASLAAARTSLLEQGVLYPGRESSHNMAALAGMGRSWGWRQEGATRLSRRTWSRVARAARRHRGRVILSSEFLSEADPATIARLVAELGPERVHVLITLRPLGRILPSSWQQGLKYGGTRRYRPWLAKVLRRRRRGGRLRGGRVRTFWRRHDHGAVVKRWADVVGADRVTVAILEGLDRTALHRLTEQRLALRAGTLTPVAEAANRSMTLPEARLVLALNRAVRRRYDWPTYSTRIRRGAILALVEGRTPPEGEATIRTPRWARAKAARLGRRAARRIRRLRASGLHVVGRPALLGREVPPAAPTGGSRHRVPIETAVAAIIGAADARTSRRESARALSRQVRSAAGSALRRTRRRVRRWVGSTTGAGRGSR